MDRLHVATLVHVLGRNCILLSNCCHKNKGIYKYLLRDNPNIKFVDFDLIG